MMQYEIGDKVVVKPWAMMEAQYGLNSDGSIKTKHEDGYTCVITQTMYSHISENRIAEISGRRDGTYRLVEDGHTWPADAFLGLHFELGEKIEVSDSDGVWKEREFWGYILSPKSKRLFMNEFGNYFRYARKLQPKLTIRVEVNGKAVDPKELSQETWNNLRK